jgi:hypothetical protein
LKNGVGILRALILEAPCGCYRGIKNKWIQNRRPSSVRSRIPISGPRKLPLRSSRMLRPASSRARRLSAWSAEVLL